MTERFRCSTQVPIAFGKPKVRIKPPEVSNFETILQVISLRAQPENISDITSCNGKFVFEFEVSKSGVFGENIELLIDDCTSVPVFDCSGCMCFLSAKSNPNIWFNHV